MASRCTPMLRLFHPVPPPRTRRAAQILCASKTTNKPKYIANQQRNTPPLSRAPHTKLKSLPTSSSQAPHSPRQPLTRLACIPLSPLPPSLPPSPPFPHSINSNYPIIDDRNTTITTIIDDMDSPADCASDKSWDRRRGTSKKVAQVNVNVGKRGSVAVKPQDELAATADGPLPAPATSPCGACKFLRRKCVSGCVFAPYFGSDQGAARFAAVHKVFGASNVSKLLLHIPAHRRHDAVVTISYEAQARLSDPVYGCVSTILQLQQQVTTLQMELSVVQTQLMNSRLAIANALQVQQQQQQQQQNMTVLPPAYSNNSVTSNNLVNISTFPSSFDLTDTAPSSRSFEPLQITRPLQDEDEDEKESGNPIVFADGFLQQRVI